MRKQEAHTVIQVPLPILEAWLGHVESWPTFLVGLESAERVGHERYRCQLVDGRDRRQVVVCVKHVPTAHRFTWRALEGPGYWGLLQLEPVDDQHTRVWLRIAAHPGTFWAGVGEMLLPRMQRAAHDLRNLEHQVASPAG